MSEIDEKGLEAAVIAYCASIGHRSDTRGPLRQIRDAAITAAIRAYLNAASSQEHAGKVADANPTAQVQDAGAMPGVEAVARVIYEAMGFSYEGRTVNVDGKPYGHWSLALDAAARALALFQPAFAALAQEVRYSRQLADAYRRQAEDAQRGQASARPTPE